MTNRLNAKIARSLAKQILKDRGYTYRQAAPLLGVCYQHLCFVLNGQRESLRLLERISELPVRKIPASAPSAPSSETPTPSAPETTTPASE